MNKPNGCIMTSYNNNDTIKKYLKHQNEINNLHGNTNNSSNLNNNDKNNNHDENSKQSSYKNNNTIITINMV